MIGTLFVGLVGVVPLSGSLPADQILLKNGHRLEGRVEIAEEGRLRVLIDEGQSVVVDPAQIMQRIPGEAPLDVLERRLERIPRDDRERYIELGHWAEEAGMRRAARRVWREVLRLDPHHAGARNRLGFALHRNRWVRREELAAQGLKLFRGTWMTEAEIETQRSEEGVAELEALLADAGHDNRFVREGAMLRILEISDPALLPALRARLTDLDPLRRMLAGRALGNYPFDTVGADLYRVFLAESRTEVRSGWAATLRAMGDRRIAGWLARDLFDPGDDPTRRRSLLTLAEACPARAAIPPLIDWISDPSWGPPASRLLATLLGVHEKSESEWRLWWTEFGGRLEVDLGSGWVQ